MTAPKQQYDVIVVGGGVNGLAVAAYLQKAGLQTAVFERRDESGTFCSTEEVLYPGVKLNLHASLLMPHYGPAYVDLELERFGLELLRPPGAQVRLLLSVPGRQRPAVLGPRRARDLRSLADASRRTTPRPSARSSTSSGAMTPLMARGGLAGRQTDESFLAFLDASAIHPDPAEGLAVDDRVSSSPTACSRTNRSSWGCSAMPPPAGWTGSAAGSPDRSRCSPF